MKCLALSTAAALLLAACATGPSVKSVAADTATSVAASSASVPTESPTATTTTIATTTTTSAPVVTVAPLPAVPINQLLPDIDSIWPKEFGPLPKWHESGMTSPDDPEPGSFSVPGVVTAYTWRRSAQLLLAASADEGTIDQIVATETAYKADAEKHLADPGYNAQSAGAWSGWCSELSGGQCFLSRRHGGRFFRVRVTYRASGLTDGTVLGRTASALAGAIDNQISLLLRSVDHPGAGAADFVRIAGPDDLLIRFDDLASIAKVDRSAITGSFNNPDEFDTAVSETGAIGQGERVAQGALMPDGTRLTNGRIGVLAYETPEAAHAAYEKYLGFQMSVGPWGDRSIGGKRSAITGVEKSSCEDVLAVAGVRCNGIVRLRALSQIVDYDGTVLAQPGDTTQGTFEYAMFINGSRLYYAIHLYGPGVASVTDLVIKQGDRLRQLGLM
jgi:hypothetical protein